MNTNINRPTVLPKQPAYFACVVDLPTSRARCISIRATAEEALECQLAGDNPRIVRIPRGILHDAALISGYVRECDATGTSVRVGA